ncbi:MAG: DUF3021 family protein [Lachnospiraceae bacterium]
MKIAKNIKSGLSIGFLMTTISVLIFNGIDKMSLELLGWCIASAIYGGSSILFEIERIKQIYINILHYIICLSTTLIMVRLFYITALLELVGILTYFTLIYIIIYVVMVIIEKKQVKEMNKQLSRK